MRSTAQHLRYSEYTVKWVTLPWEADEAYALRRRVFCAEQALFEGDDRDITDNRAQLLVVLGGFGGWHEQVVGTVRIHEEAPGLWYGSRLAVDPAFRSQGHLGAMLIKLAVSSAHALGCEQFLARVQAQNELLFRRLHWERIGEEMILGREHVIMEAQLAHYPPCHDPRSGFVLRSRTRRTADELAPCLTALPALLPQVGLAAGAVATAGAA